jgi:hypothetical protein
MATKEKGAWWYMPVIPALWRLKQQDCKFKVSLGYIANSMPSWATG